LLLVDDRPDVGRFVERVADLERRGLLLQAVEERVEDVAVQKRAATRRCRTGSTA
jgi:hypothetical protein